MRTALLALLLGWPTLCGANGYDGPESPVPPKMWDLALELKTLNSLQQIGRLQEVLQQYPDQAAIQALTEALIKPSPETMTKATRYVVYGDATNTAQLIHLAAQLHIEARGDERVMAGLDALSRGLETGKWYDGRPPQKEPAVESPRPGEPAEDLAGVVSWPLSGAADQERRVHALALDGLGRALIDGKPARLLSKKESDGVADETFVHPGDDGLLVRLYRSPGSLAAFERKSAKVEALAPLSEAGAAPRLLEHGEAPLAGAGRAYFYVQERAEGTRLDAAPFENRTMEQVLRLFERLKQAGLALVVPGPSRSWLESHLMIGRTAGGGEGAYLLGGSWRRAGASELKAHYEMLLAILKPGQAGEAAVAPAAPVEAEPSAESLKWGVHDLYALIKMVTNRTDRDNMLIKIPASAYEKSTSPDIAALLSLLMTPSFVDRFPEAAWRGLERRDVALLIKQLAATSQPVIARAIAARWLTVHHETGAGAWADYYALAKALPEKDFPGLLTSSQWRAAAADAPVQEIVDALEARPEGAERDKLILSIPAAVYKKMMGAAAASVLRLVGKDGELEKGTVYKRLPPEAWRAITSGDMEGLMRRWLSIKYWYTTRVVLSLWALVREPDLVARDYLDLFSLIPETEPDKSGIVDRDNGVMDLPAAVYAKMSSPDIAAVLALVSVKSEGKEGTIYNRVAPEAWRGLDRQDAEKLRQKWLGISFTGTVSVIATLWNQAHPGQRHLN